MLGRWLKRISDSLKFILITFLILIPVFYFYCLRMPGISYTSEAELPTADNLSLQSRLRSHVQVLSDDIGERHALYPVKLEKAASYIENQFIEMKFIPRSEEINNKGHRNIIVENYGGSERNKVIIIGAHYDSVILSPGADDNASGVAVLLELANKYKNKRLAYTLRFIAFVNEERPYFGGDDMGSVYHAKRTKERNEEIIGMYSIEMVGYYNEQPGSQRYPPIVRNFYPDKANFIAFIGNLMSRDFALMSISSFRDNARLPSEGLVAPQFLVPDIRRSDHSSFWFHGIPAIMITDTSNFRNRNYHRFHDTIETLNFNSMARLLEGLDGMLESMALEMENGTN